MGNETTVKTTTVAGALTVISIWAVATFGGVEIPVEVGAAITVLATALISYITPAKKTA